jgi:hypothetical protein
METIPNARQFVNATSFEDAIVKVMAIKSAPFEDVVFGIINDSGLGQTVLVKGLVKKLIDSGFTDTEQVIFAGALIATCIDTTLIKQLFSEQNIEFLVDVDN